MTVERETAGFALPFAIGAILAVHTGNLLYNSNFKITIIISALILACLIFMLTPARHVLTSGQKGLFIALLALLTGIFCGFNDLILSISRTEGMLIQTAMRFGERAKTAIDGMEFADQRTNAVIKAFVTGDRSGMPRSLTESFRESGAAHILALSGFHLGIIYTITRHSLACIGNTGKALAFRSTATIITCGFYTLATGASPSTVRALIFMTLKEVSLLTHRCRTLIQFLLSSLVIQLAISPSSALTVSFQLSYAAMAGIAFIYPKLKSAWTEAADSSRSSWKLLRRIWDSAAISISCQLSTAPLAWFHFQSFPRHFLLTNLMALPLTALIIPVSLLALFLHQAGICPEFLMNATEFLISILISTLEIISTM